MNTTLALHRRLALVLRLGVADVARALLYRQALRSGLAARRLRIHEHAPGAMLLLRDDPADNPSGDPSGARSRGPDTSTADRHEQGKLLYFDHQWQAIGAPPDWFINPFSVTRHAGRERHWSRLADFDAGGDIKVIWEPSRFAWALSFARAWRADGDVRHLRHLQLWLEDWNAHNPINAGPNWKCGQETAIRLLHLLLALRLSGERLQAGPAMGAWVTAHCRRIAATTAYARAQRNNHAVVEAVGLFVGASWLLARGDAPQPAVRRRQRDWQRRGRRQLERCISSLVAADGSFSQHSTVYHRLLLDGLCQAELWRRWLRQPAFSARFQRRAAAAVNWLYQLTDDADGDAPNLGANDGSRLFKLDDTPYRDFRGTLQLAAILFCDGPLYGPGPWDPPLAWLGIAARPRQAPARVSTVFDNGGYALLRGTRSWGLLRLARRRFRPAHADALHLDLWLDGHNLLRDGGSYSYAAGPPWQAYFPGAAAHNTVEFGGADPMPRAGRFLFASWIETHGDPVIEQLPDGLRYSAAYRDYRGCRHRRSVGVQGDHWRVDDEFDGGNLGAVLRWRLDPTLDWRLEGRRCHSALASIELEPGSGLIGLDLVTGHESRHYLERTELPVLEARFAVGARRVRTHIYPRVVA